MKKEEWQKGERLLSATPNEVTLRSLLFTIEPARTMRADGFEWDHEIRVALPVSYMESERTYPVLWIMDNDLEVALHSVGSAEVILVSVGAGAGVPLQEELRRRAYDFYSVEDFFPHGPAGDAIRTFPGMQHSRGGGARHFLDFLIDTVRPALAADYRMSDDHCLQGYSSGGAFVAYSIFARPGGFTRYICGSGSFDTVWPLEEQYAADHDDLSAHIFLAAGELEPIDHPAWNNLSSIAKLAERLTLRNYHSLNLTLKILPGETHRTMPGPVISWGVRSVWGDETLYQAPTNQGDTTARS